MPTGTPSSHDNLGHHQGAARQACRLTQVATTCMSGCSAVCPTLLPPGYTNLHGFDQPSVLAQPFCRPQYSSEASAGVNWANTSSVDAVAAWKHASSWRMHIRRTKPGGRNQDSATRTSLRASALSAGVDAMAPSGPCRQGRDPCPPLSDRHTGCQHRSNHEAEAYSHAEKRKKLNSYRLWRLSQQMKTAQCRPPAQPARGLGAMVAARCRALLRGAAAAGGAIRRPAEAAHRGLSGRNTPQPSRQVPVAFSLHNTRLLP